MYRAAKRHYQRAIRLDETYAPSWNGLGYASLKLGLQADAQANFGRAIDLDPIYGWSYLNWARSLRTQCKYETAIEKVRVAVERTSLRAKGYTLWATSSSTWANSRRPIEFTS
jgi:tetratricopeptide (TPR) repeat protein